MTKPSRKVKQASTAVIAADGAVAKAVAPYAKSKPVQLAGLLSELGDQPPMRTLCAATLAAGLAGPHHRLTRAGIRMIAAHTLATLAKDFVKKRIDRTRPRNGNDHKPRPGHRTDKEWTSFPSGHSAGAAAVGRAYAREFPEHEAAALTGAGAIALAQVPRSAHYPTDVGVGLAIGLASELIVDRLFASFIPAEPREDEPPER